jgi:DNA-binding LacI/PurR family transcriptional regulator
MQTRSRPESKRSKASEPVPTIGLLVDCLEDSYQWSVLRGAMDAARTYGARLVCFAGGVLDAPRGDGGERNGVFDLAGPRNVDGLVILSGAIGNRIGSDRLREYCARFRPLPMCSIAVELADMSSVCIDNESGMRAAIEHLIRVHDRNHIAFVRGPVANAEAERRFDVYRLALEAGCIPFSERYVVIGDFERSGGRKAVRTLLRERKIDLHDLDAIVTANDQMALGVLDELADARIRVPDQVAVVGFDDIDEARFTAPPLTTVRQPLYEQGRDAVRIVLDQLRNGAPQQRIVRNTELVTRRSCRCQASHPTSTRYPGGPDSWPGLDTAMVQRNKMMLADINRAAGGELSAAGDGWAERLLNSFVEQVRGELEDAFSYSYDDFLREMVASESDLSVCNEVLSALRAHVVPTLVANTNRMVRAEDLLHEARKATAEVMARVEARRRVHAEKCARSLGRAAAAIASAHDLDGLSRAVEQHLPALGIPRCYVATYDGSRGEERMARIALAHTPDRPRKDGPSQQPHLAADIVRHHVLPTAGERPLVVLPTVFRGEELGILILELEAADGYLYETLREAFTAAVAGVRSS